MRKFLYGLFLLSVFLVSGDFIIGYLARSLQSKATTGTTFVSEYIANRMKDSLVIMGSSRAIHHYDPQVFEDSLGLTSYNIGMDGYGIILHYGRYRLLSNRYNPSVIIYDIEPFYDLLTDDCNFLSGDSTRYLNYLKQYHEFAPIDSIIRAIYPLERYKCYSSMYCYNSKLFQILSDCLKQNIPDTKGYDPLFGTMDSTTNEMSFEVKYSPLKLSLIEKLIIDCKNKTQLIFCISPTVRSISLDVFYPLLVLSEKYDIPILNHLNDTTFTNHRELFKDSYHLNYSGAELYTQLITREVKIYEDQH